MYSNAIDRMSEFNPQLFRELKSRLKPTSITLAVAISLTGQIFCLMLFGNHLNDLTPREWQSWFWLNFISLSGVGIFSWLVIGSYLLIADISKEQEKGTLNVLRLSPESAKNILIGKSIGVPIILYLVAILALPLHFFSGLAAGVSLIVMLGFYAVLISSCIFFYSLALLFALLPAVQGNLKAGLFSGGLVLKLLMSYLIISTVNLSSSPFNWISCFNPWLFLENSLTDRFYNYGRVLEISWYNISLHDSGIATGIFLVLNYGLWTFLIWQGLQRWFHNPTSNLFTKAQSYMFATSWQIVILGFVANSNSGKSKESYWDNFCVLMLFDLVLYCILLSALTPNRQSVLDWARYKHYYKFGGTNKLWQDLVLGEKSPAVVAIGINTIIASLILVPWILSSAKPGFTIAALSSLAMAIALTLIYALVTQIVLLSKNPQRAVLTAASLAALAIAPPAFAIANYTNLERTTWVWLFSIFPWAGLSVTAIEPLGIISACLIQWLGVTILSWQLQRRIQAIGSSKLLKA